MSEAAVKEHNVKYYVEKKSIRQLLDEYNTASTSAGRDEPKKKSWWSRG